MGNRNAKDPPAPAEPTVYRRKPEEKPPDRRVCHFVPIGAPLVGKTCLLHITTRIRLLPESHVQALCSRTLTGSSPNCDATCLVDTTPSCETFPVDFDKDLYFVDRGNTVFVYVFSRVDPSSLVFLRSLHLRVVERWKPDPVILLAGTKSDLVAGSESKSEVQAVQPYQVLPFMKEFKACGYFEVESKLNETRSGVEILAEAQKLRLLMPLKVVYDSDEKLKTEEEEEEGERGEGAEVEGGNEEGEEGEKIDPTFGWEGLYEYRDQKMLGFEETYSSELVDKRAEFRENRRVQREECEVLRGQFAIVAFPLDLVQYICEFLLIDVRLVFDRLNPGLFWIPEFSEILKTEEDLAPFLLEWFFVDTRVDPRQVTQLFCHFRLTMQDDFTLIPRYFQTLIVTDLVYDPARVTFFRRAADAFYSRDLPFDTAQVVWDTPSLSHLRDCGVSRHLNLFCRNGPDRTSWAQIPNFVSKFDQLEFLSVIDGRKEYYYLPKELEGHYELPNVRGLELTGEFIRVPLRKDALPVLQVLRLTAQFHNRRQNELDLPRIRAILDLPSLRFLQLSWVLFAIDEPDKEIPNFFSSRLQVLVLDRCANYQEGAELKNMDEWVLPADTNLRVFVVVLPHGGHAASLTFSPGLVESLEALKREEPMGVPITSESRPSLLLPEFSETGNGLDYVLRTGRRGEVKTFSNLPEDEVDPFLKFFCCSDCLLID